MYYINNDLETDQKFDMIKFMKFDNDNCDPLNSYIIGNIKKLPQLGSYKIINYAYRPEMQSYYLYGDTQYWWTLMLYNDINNINELVTGLTLKYPSLNSLQTLYINASTYRKTQGND